MARRFVTTNYLQLDAPPAPGSVGSISVKFKPIGWSSGDSVFHTIWEYHNASGSTVLTFLKFSNNTIFVGWYNEPVEHRIIVSDAGLFADGVWNTFVLTWDSAEPATRFYGQAGSIGSNLTTFTAALFGDGRFGLGNDSGSPGAGGAGLSPAEGDCAEFGRWNRKLNSTERAYLLTDGKGPGCITSGLVHWVRVLGNVSPETADVGNDLVLVGTPAQSTHPTVNNCPPPITPSRIASTATVFAPTILGGGVTIPSLIASSAQLFAPTLSGVMQPAFLASSAGIFAPGVHIPSIPGLKITISDRLAQG